MTEVLVAAVVLTNADMLGTGKQQRCWVLENGRGVASSK